MAMPMTTDRANFGRTPAEIPPAVLTPRGETLVALIRLERLWPGRAPRPGCPDPPVVMHGSQRDGGPADRV